MFQTCRFRQMENNYVEYQIDNLYGRRCILNRLFCKSDFKLVLDWWRSRALCYDWLWVTSPSGLMVPSSAKFFGSCIRSDLEVSFWLWKTNFEFEFDPLRMVPLIQFEYFSNKPSLLFRHSMSSRNCQFFQFRFRTNLIKIKSKNLLLGLLEVLLPLF